MLKLKAKGHAKQLHLLSIYLCKTGMQRCVHTHAHCPLIQCLDHKTVKQNSLLVDFTFFD